MANEPNQPGNTPPEKSRDEEIAEWKESQSGSMLQGTKGNSKLSGIAIVVMAAAALGFVWWLKHEPTDSKQAEKRADEVVAAERRKVQNPTPKREAAKVAPVTNDGEPGAPAATPRSTVDRQQQQGGMSDAEKRRQAIALQEELERKKMLAARQRSAIFSSVNEDGPQQDPAAGQQGGAGSLSGGGRGAGRASQNPNDSFAASTYSSGVPVSEARAMENLEFKVLQGAVIEGTLQPRAQSSLPGQICVSIAQDVYAAEGRRVLIPWGSSICGSYNASLQPGQERLFTIWNWLRIPKLHGRRAMEIAIDSAGTDQLGSAGQGGVVNNHWAQIFGVATAVSIIGAGASNSGVSSTDQENSASQYRSQVQEAAAESSNTILSRYANIQPTVTVPHGSRVVIYLQRDLDFSKQYAEEAEQAQSGGVKLIN
ncbi:MULTISPECIES: TrbI/VirB10 family protein [Pseudomonas]|uniref:Inner membrane protein of type IV secretion of T-DNA complex, TonB-like, VirB1 n=1 Tax=Pseudomonas syringae pv. actinidiae TaxID=103796 RepID=A0A2P0QFN9_PSESF|nr:MULTISPECIES: TrbI/VirB10 family protein [Pseudomonas]APQ06996.1 mating pair formation protein [Pseudomonas syringae pv. actinidiae]ARO44981.1 Inner membrane protein of type IV secretion of T-DNA complex, TonB-like, VirB10 [Pseudomonas syringae pv. actinidiae]ARO45086.1 Inner membrane protein of type IV secretion of T-DNA complex, TonB-like, VirB1 [Pseudomonas syringae pv. actinidiae]ARO45177.1 Inner membrane protein of type IV secretion of T-DNA complex, TonB-like, VirB10 [Pseudomonas syrin